MRASSRLFGAIAAFAIGAQAFGADLLPGGSLDPAPVSFNAPFGTVIHESTVPIAISHNIPPFNLCTGDLHQRVTRTPDETLTFTYWITMNAICISVDNFSVGGYSGFDIDATAAFGISVGTTSISRSFLTGSSVTVTYNSGVAPGGTGRAVYLDTNATDFELTGTGTVRAGSFSDGLSGVARPVEDMSPPVTEITSPSPLGCACNPVEIVGTAHDPAGLGSYAVEWSSTPNGPWSLIAFGFGGSVQDDVLATWNTAGVPHGYQFVRVRATNAVGMTSSTTSVVFVDHAFADLELRRPLDGQVLGGRICFDGTAWDNCFDSYLCEYAAPGDPFAPVDAGTPVYTTAVINDPLGSWNTRTGSTAVPDGTYSVQLSALDQCGNGDATTADVIVDNTPPRAEIDAPVSCSNVEGIVTVTGTASDTNMRQWVLEYAGGVSNRWVRIASGDTNVNGGVLAQWDTTDLRKCAYALRLRVWDEALIDCGPNTNSNEFVTLVTVGCEADFNGDGFDDIFDLLAFLDLWFQGC